MHNILKLPLKSVFIIYFNWGNICPLIPCKHPEALELKVHFDVDAWATWTELSQWMFLSPYLSTDRGTTHLATWRLLNTLDRLEKVPMSRPHVLLLLILVLVLRLLLVLLLISCACLVLLLLIYCSCSTHVLFLSSPFLSVLQNQTPISWRGGSSSSRPMWPWAMSTGTRARS